MRIWVTEFRFIGNVEWKPRGDGKRIDAHACEGDALDTVRRKRDLFGHNTEYRIIEYVREEAGND